MQDLHLKADVVFGTLIPPIFPLFLYMIADIRKYVIWKSKFEITIPIQWCLCKSHEKSYWICKTLRNNATLSMRYSLCLLHYSRARGKENDINFALLFFTLMLLLSLLEALEGVFVYIEAQIETQSSWYSEVSLLVDGCHRFFAPFYLYRYFLRHLVLDTLLTTLF